MKNGSRDTDMMPHGGNVSGKAAAKTKFISRAALVAASGAAVIGGAALFAKVVAAGVEKAVPADGDFVDIDGTTLHYLDRGTGPAIVMIHGLGGQMRNFRYAMLDALAGDHRVILIDRPGSGYATPARGLGANARAQADVIAAFIARLDLDRPLVVGHSLGGAVALALALDHSQAVGGLALIAPLTQPQEAVPDVFKGLAIGSPMLRRAIAWTMATPMGLATGEATARAVFAPEAVPADFRYKGGAALTLRPSNYYAASSDLVAANDDLPAMRDCYGDLAMPIGILFGRDDAILDPELHGAGLAAQVDGASLTLMDGGHMIPVTRPDAVVAWVRDRAARLASG